MINKFTWLTVIAVNIILTGCGNNSSEKPIEAELKQVTFQLDSAWNNGNAIEFANFWTENAINVSPMGEIMEGRKTIEQNMAMEFSGSMKGSTHKLIIKKAYSVSSTVAVADGIAEVATGDYEPWTSMFTAVFSKNENNVWKIAHMRAYIFYPD
ncbi:MAG: DUF4440 domain-containing protein [Treponema sp.]|nr:DUF4440 domain-containing protein [Treponema sp.]